MASFVDNTNNAYARSVRTRSNRPYDRRAPPSMTAIAPYGVPESEKNQTMCGLTNEWTPKVSSNRTYEQITRGKRRALGNTADSFYNNGPRAID